MSARKSKKAKAPPGKRGDLQRLQTEHDVVLRALQAAIRDTTRLTRLFTILSEHAPLEHLLDQLLSTLSELFSSDLVILLQRTETGRFSVRKTIGLPEELIQQSISGAEDSYPSLAVQNRVPVLVADALNDPRIDPQLRELDVRSAAWLPVVGNEGVMAVLVLARCRTAAYAPADVDLLMVMAYRIGLLLERARSEAMLHEAQERLLQTEKLALAGNLAGSVAHEVNNPLACLYANLDLLQWHLPVFTATFRAAREAASYLMNQSDPAAQTRGRALLAAMKGASTSYNITDELAGILTDSMVAARRIGHLVASFKRLANPDQPAEPERLDVQNVIGECISDLPPDTGRPGLVQESGNGPPCIAWIAPVVFKAALTGLLRFLLAPDPRRVGSGAAVVIRVEHWEGKPAVIISDPDINLTDQERRRVFDPRLEAVETPEGRIVHLSLVAALSYQLLRGCGAELSTVPLGTRGLTIRILLPGVPGTTTERK